jgi:hypothetical protein
LDAGDECFQNLEAKSAAQIWSVLGLNDITLKWERGNGGGEVLVVIFVSSDLDSDYQTSYQLKNLGRCAPQLMLNGKLVRPTGGEVLNCFSPKELDFFGCSRALPALTLQRRRKFEVFSVWMILLWNGKGETVHVTAQFQLTITVWGS